MPDKKFYVYRNSTVEPLFKGLDATFSSYNGIEKTDEDREIFITYFLPFTFDKSELLTFLKDFPSRIEYISKQYNKTIHVLRLKNYFYSSLILGDNEIDELINEANQKLKSIKNVETFAFDFTFDPKYYYTYNTIASPKDKDNFQNAIKPFFESRKKAIVVDLDNTLWGGIVGEDGVNGIKLSGSYPGNVFQDFQKLLKSIAETGILLCICSKNNEEDAKEAFKKRDDFILKYDDFLIKDFGWGPKPARIKNIAKKLGIGLDAIVFVDDNPMEREAVKSEIEDIIVPDFPNDLYNIPSFFKQEFNKYFSTTTLTDEDKNKKQSYEQKLKTDDYRESFESEDDFIKNLNIKTEIGEMNEENIARIEQLINKSNQFNLTTKRYSEDELRSLQKDGHKIYYIKVSDKFGDYGISGVAIIKLKNIEAEIDSFLFSCRVLGRKIEGEFLEQIISEMKKCSVKDLKAKYIKTKKNSLVKSFYDQHGFKVTDKTENETNYLYEQE